MKAYTDRIAALETANEGSHRMLNQPELTNDRHPSAVAQIPLLSLDWLWFYVPGTLCNLECAHCLVAGGPHSRTLIPMEVAELEHALREITAYQNGHPFQIGFTGGEVFILKSQKFGRRLFPLVEKALQYADLLILTNGILADAVTLEALIEIERKSSHAITYRVSIDGPTAEENDEIRYYPGGKPTFHLIVESLHRFLDHGIYPAIAYTYEGTGKAAEVLHSKEVLEKRYKQMLQNYGLDGLELWGIPFFDQGYETVRRDKTGLAHIESPGITNHCIASYTNNDFHLFQCSYSRTFAKEPDGACGWYKCPILTAKKIDNNAFLGRSLQSSSRNVVLEHPQCFTCFAAATQGMGMSCCGK